METKRSLAVFRNHCLAVLEYAQSVEQLSHFRYDTAHSHRTTMQQTQQHLCATRYQIDYGWSKFVARTFSFKALRNPLVSTILTKESFGYKEAETSDGMRVRADIAKENSRILIVERKDVVMLVSYQTTSARVTTWL
jgi:hypothetical protein